MAVRDRSYSVTKGCGSIYMMERCSSRSATDSYASCCLIGGVLEVMCDKEVLVLVYDQEV